MAGGKHTKSLRILGVMTGTSCDALDAACIEFDASGWRPLWNASSPYPRELRERVLRVQARDSLAKSAWAAKPWLELTRDLGLWYGEALRRMIRKFPDTPDVIANHGQTVAHFPGAGVTLQLGDPTRIAAATGLTVTSFFRQGDLAAGGQGAPLVPRFHQLLAGHLDPENHGTAIHNIGGISNLTYIGPEARLLAFDTGPGNIWMDAATELVTRGKLKFDRNGELAARGEVDVKAVEKILKHPFFLQKPPKSTGRDDFPLKLLQSHTRAKGADLVATATAVTVESIARAYEKWILGKRRPLEAIYFCGGGARNTTLMDWLAIRLQGVDVRDLEDAGFDSQLIEAQAFAFLGFLSLLGQPLGGEWTGTRGFAPPGHLIPGANWGEVLMKLQSIST